jgi:hypothetical protein
MGQDQSHPEDRIARASPYFRSIARNLPAVKCENFLAATS